MSFFLDNYFYYSKYENIGWEKGKNIIQVAKIKNGEIFINVRDFDFKTGKEKYFLENFKVKDIENIKYGYIFLKLKSLNFVHNYFILEFKNNKNFIFSIETRKHKGEKINFKNLLTNKYNIIKIFSTKSDLYSYINKNNYKFMEFNLNLSKKRKN